MDPARARGCDPLSGAERTTEDRRRYQIAGFRATSSRGCAPGPGRRERQPWPALCRSSLSGTAMNQQPDVGQWPAPAARHRRHNSCAGTRSASSVPPVRGAVRRPVLIFPAASPWRRARFPRLPDPPGPAASTSRGTTGCSAGCRGCRRSSSRTTSIFTRLPYVEALAPMEVVMGVAAVVLTLEACRRSIGLAAVLFAIFFTHARSASSFWPAQADAGSTGCSTPLHGLVGSRLGHWHLRDLRSDVRAARRDAQRAGGALFMNLAVGLMGGSPRWHRQGRRGLGLFGISGSAVANVYATGTFTIRDEAHRLPPVLRRGRRGVASSSGQLVPPIMGSRVPDRRLHAPAVPRHRGGRDAARVPGLFAVMVMVHLESVSTAAGDGARVGAAGAQRRELHVHLLLVLVIVVAMPSTGAPHSSPPT